MTLVSLGTIISPTLRLQGLKPLKNEIGYVAAKAATYKARDIFSVPLEPIHLAALLSGIFVDCQATTCQRPLRFRNVPVFR
jgi:hypothetical protein